MATTLGVTGASSVLAVLGTGQTQVRVIFEWLQMLDAKRSDLTATMAKKNMVAKDLTDVVQAMKSLLDKLPAGTSSSEPWGETAARLGEFWNGPPLFAINDALKKALDDKAIKAGPFSLLDGGY